NLVNGLGQINCDALHNDSPAQKSSTPWYRTVVWGESITAFKPNLLRYTKAMAERACHGFGSTTQVGLTQALGSRCAGAFS
ncbi:hypothetical protein RMR41_31600, partial [Pseudomonas aeruginosa]